MLVRALHIWADAALMGQDWGVAARVAQELVALEPFRETAYRQLMRAQAGAGNRAEALRVYERCRALMGDELGVDPSSETQAYHLEILRSPSLPVRTGRRGGMAGYRRRRNSAAATPPRLSAGRHSSTGSTPCSTRPRRAPRRSRS